MEGGIDNTMRIKTTIPIILLILALPLFFVQTEAQDLGYEDGYEDGVRAAKEDANQMGTYLSTNPKQPIPPPSTRENLKDKPKQYREGFLDGYKSTFPRAANTSPTMYLMLFGLLAAVGLVLGLLIK